MTSLELRLPVADEADAVSERVKKKSEFSTGRFLAWLVMAAVLVITLFPFWWALRTGLSTNGSLFAGEQSLLPIETTTVNFERVLGRASEAEILEAIGRSRATSFDFVQSLKVSLIVSTVVTVGQVFFSGLAAYAFARLEFRGRDQLFMLFLSGLMIPPIFILIPNLILMRELEWFNTYQGLIAPFLFMTPFAVFFLRQFFLGISKEVEEAALLDGAGNFRTFFGIIVPMSAAPIATLGILTFVTAWNEYLWPLTVGRDPSRQPLTVALGQFTAQQPGSAPDWTGLMSAALLAASPILVVFLVFGRRVVDSVGFSGIK